MAAHSESSPACVQTSKQLLYSEKFEGSLEDKLKIVGKKDVGPKKTFRPPPSSVLSRAQAFLPELALANEKLKTLPPSEVDIENVDPTHDGPLIEMDFALMPQVGSEDEGNGDEVESDDDENTDDEIQSKAASEPVKISMVNSKQQQPAATQKVCVIDKEAERDNND